MRKPTLNGLAFVFVKEIKTGEEKQLAKDTPKKEKPSLNKEGFLAVNRCMNKNNLCYLTIYTAGVKKVTPLVKKNQ